MRECLFPPIGRPDLSDDLVVVLFASCRSACARSMKSGGYVQGTDPGAPVDPQLLEKALLTTRSRWSSSDLLMLVLRLSAGERLRRAQ